MGVKRPFDEEEALQELSFKQAKPLDGNIKPSSFAYDTISQHEVSEITAITGDVKDIEGNNNKAEKELETSADLSWVTSSSSSEEESGSHFLHFFPDLFEFNYPKHPPNQFNDAVTSCPRKEVPIGPESQADIPEWNPNALRKDDDNDKKLMGKTVINMPDSDVKVGLGRIDCVCFDHGSIRCARQHIEESRIKLKESIGEDKFGDLGFYEMGEEVAINWSEEEERLFHEVVYSNPASHGKNFWKQLSGVFPSRTKMELISYYFNVFILRRRAVQNRSAFLDIDSDDDEWQGNGVQVDHDDDDSDDGDDGEMNGQDDFEKSDSKEELQDDKMGQDVKKDDEFTTMGYNEIRGNEVNNHHVRYFDGYVYEESCEVIKHWDINTFPTSSDLLPTYNMIEEVFGPSDLQDD